MPKIPQYLETIFNHGEQFKAVKYLDGTSDLKCLTEVVIRKHYRRIKYGFDVSEGETWLDFGANIGAFGVYCELRGASVVGYEPYKPCHFLARQNCPESVMIHSAVTLETTPTIPLYLLKDGVNLRYRGAVKRTARLRIPTIVPNTSLHTILTQKNGQEWDGVKMDIEGQEFEFIDRKILPKCKKLVFEYHMIKDLSITNLTRRIAWLKTQFDHVRYGDEYERLMRGEKTKRPYFDRLIFCYNDE